MTQEASHMRLGAMGLSHAVRCPEGWENCRLRFLSRINKPGKVEMPPESEVSFVPMAAIGENGGLQLDQIKSLDEIGDGYTPLFDGDVVVAKITPCFENGKGALAEGLENGTAFGTTELHVLQPGEEIDRRFLFYLSISELFRELGEGAMYGAGGQKRVPDRFIKDFRAPVPPLHLQKKIADFLDRKTAEIDTLIAKKRRLLDLLAEKRTALITRAVTKGLNPDVPMKDSGIEWLGEIPAHWAVPLLRHVAEVRGGVTKGRKLPELETIEVPYLRVANVQDGFLDLDDIKNIEVSISEFTQYALQPGDVLMNEGGDNDKLGRGAVWRGEIEPCLHQNHVFAVRPKIPNLSEWLSLLTQSKYGKHYFWMTAKQSTNLASISSSNIKRLPVILPPESERTAIVEYANKELNRFDVQNEKISLAISRLQEYRSALITNAVTGQINVA